jgi:glutaredoxin 3
MSKNFVLGADWCPFCIKVKNHLEKKNIPHEWVDTDNPEGAKKRQELSAKHKWNTIPMVFVEGQFVGGCDEFFDALAKKRINL